MKTVIRNSYTPKLGDYCETIVVDKETNNAYIFDCDGVFTPVPQPVDVEKILEEAAEYTDEQVAPLAEKLDTIEEGAQVNTIERILQNGTELTITDKTVNVTVPTKTSDLTNDGSDGTDTYVETADLNNYYTKDETDTQIGYETTAREIADTGLQEQIDAIVASSDVVDIVGTYAALQAYDTSKLHDNDIIKVLADETRDDATTYYRWDKDTSTWSYIGAEGPFYTKAESDATFVPQTRTVNNKALSADITLTASDVGALPDSTVIPTVNDATLTIQKNGTNVATFTANSATNATANIEVPTDTSDLTNGAGFITSAALPTKTSDLTNDGSDGTSTYVEADEMPTKTSDFTNDGSDGTSTYIEADELATVATTGDYDDLLNKPTIPTVNNATLTIQKNGTDVASFTANSSTATTANITVPTDTSDLTNGAGFITTAALANYYTKSETYSQNEVNSLINSLSIPTKTSDLVNDSGFLTSIPIASANDLGGVKIGTGLAIDADGVVSVTSAGSVAWADVTGKPSNVSYWTNDAGYITSADIPTNVSSFTNDAGYITSSDIPTNVSAFTNDAGYLTSSALSNYYTKSETYTQSEVNSLINTIAIPSKTSDLTNDGADGTSTYVEADDLATVATSGDYDDLTNKPTIPTIVDMTGATASTAGAHGYVPAPAAGDQDKMLRGDGTWATPPAPELVEMSYGESNAWAKFIDAYNRKCIVYCRASSNANPATGAKTRKAFMAYVNNETTPTQVEFQYYRSVSSHSDSQQGDQVFVYLLKNDNTWSVTTRDTFSKIVAGTSMTSSYSGGTLTLNGKTVDSALSVSSTNPVQNSVVTAALDGKQPTLTAGSNITIDANNEISATDTTYSAGTGIDITGTTVSVDTSVIAEVSDLPTKTSDLTNDGSDGTSTYVEADELATIATTGDYDDLTDKPTIGNATLTIQKNGTSIDTFTANATTNKTINITVPTTAADVSALPASTKYGASIAVSINTTDYKVTTTLKDQDGNTLGTAQVIDLPLESVVVNGSYDNVNKKIVLTLQNGNTIDIPVGDLVSGLQTEITSSNKLDADLVDDSTSTNKFTTAADISKLAGIASGAEVNVQSDWDVSDNTSDAYIKNKPTIPTVNNGTLTIQKNGASVATFTANQSTAATANITVPTKTSDLSNDSGFLTTVAWGDVTGKPTFATVATSGDYNDLTNKPTIPTVPTKTSDLTNDGSDGTSYYVDYDDLATVASSGSYNDLSDKPTIPTVNDGVLTIQRNGTDVQTFSANAASNTTANIQVPNLLTQDTDPGEGAPLAADTFLGVYDAAPSAINGSRITDGTITNAKLNQSSITAAAIAKTWTTAPYNTGYKASTNTGAPQSIQCCVWNGVFYLKFGVSPSSGSFDTNENVVGKLPLTLDGVDLTKMFSLDDHRVMRGFATGAGTTFGFFGLAYAEGDSYVRLTLRCFQASGWMEGSIALRVEE